MLVQYQTMSSDDNSKKLSTSGYPGYGSYLECMTRSFFSGLSTFSIVFAGTFFGQRFIQRSSSYPKKRTILISTPVAVIASYYVASKRTKLCRESWPKTNEN